MSSLGHWRAPSCTILPHPSCPQLAEAKVSDAKRLIEVKKKLIQYEHARKKLLGQMSQNLTITYDYPSCEDATKPPPGHPAVTPSNTVGSDMRCPHMAMMAAKASSQTGAQPTHEAPPPKVYVRNL